MDRGARWRGKRYTAKSATDRYHHDDINSLRTKGYAKIQSAAASLPSQTVYKTFWSLPPGHSYDPTTRHIMFGKDKHHGNGYAPPSYGATEPMHANGKQPWFHRASLLLFLWASKPLTLFNNRR